MLHALILLAAVTGVWLPQKSGTDVELRGVAVLDARHAWVSGAGGTILRTRDGEHWESLAVKASDKLDFRDVEVLDADTVVLLSVGPAEASRVYKSTDGGSTWRLCHANPHKAGFYDAIAFWDAHAGILLGDPVNGAFIVRVTGDGGRTWYVPRGIDMPAALPAEGAFAASGTCLSVRKGGQEAWFVTGGAGVSRVFRSADRGRTWSVAEAPIPAGKSTAGLFSVGFSDSKAGFVAGGDYKDVALKSLNGARTEDGGATWLPAPVSASGFFSAVVAIPGALSELVAVGPVGSAASHDGGKTWTKMGDTPLNAVAFSDAKTGWAVGPKGTIVRYQLAAR